MWQLVLLVFGDYRFDWRQFEDLVPPRLWFVTGQRLATSAARSGPQRDDFIHFIGRDERPLMFAMTFLSAAFLLRFRFRRCGFRMRVLRRGRQRGVLGCFAQPRFEFVDAGQQHLDECTNRRRHLSFKFRRNRQTGPVSIHGGKHRQSRDS